jgi:zinc transporter ZupT
MPALTRWFIKSGLVCFVVAFLLGIALAAPAVISVPPAIGVWGPVYFHLLMVGWGSQLIFGIVYWMFPRYTKESPRGNEKLALATFVLLKSGLVGRATPSAILADAAAAYRILVTWMDAAVGHGRRLLDFATLSTRARKRE